MINDHDLQLMVDKISHFVPNFPFMSMTFSSFNWVCPLNRSNQQVTSPATINPSILSPLEFCIATSHVTRTKKNKKPFCHCSAC